MLKFRRWFFGEGGMKKGWLFEITTKTLLLNRPWSQITAGITIFTICILWLFFLEFFYIEEFAVSMEPTLQRLDRLVTLRVVRSINRYDIITFTKEMRRADGGWEPQVLVKRVVGLPGEIIQVLGTCVFIQGKLLHDEPYLKTQECWLFAPKLNQFSDERGVTFELADDQYFVLGDNRENSWDSRNFGPIPKNAIRGKVFFRYWPHARIRSFIGKRW